MFQSFEMNNHEQQQRHNCMRAHDHWKTAPWKVAKGRKDRYIDMLNTGRQNILST
jgi:hypothetical protein